MSLPSCSCVGYNVVAGHQRHCLYARLERLERQVAHVERLLVRMTLRTLTHPDLS